MIHDCNPHETDKHITVHLNRHILMRIRHKLFSESVFCLIIVV